MLLALVIRQRGVQGLVVGHLELDVRSVEHILIHCFSIDVVIAPVELLNKLILDLVEPL